MAGREELDDSRAMICNRNGIGARSGLIFGPAMFNFDIKFYFFAFTRQADRGYIEKWSPQNI
jgi:hypothetical protein